MVDSYRWERIPLRNGTGQIPVLGFGTLIADPEATRIATGDALEAGFRHFDCAERYRNEREVGDALRRRVGGMLQPSPQHPARGDSTPHPDLRSDLPLKGGGN